MPLYFGLDEIDSWAHRKKKNKIATDLEEKRKLQRSRNISHSWRCDKRADPKIWLNNPGT
jgi:hypothetical protein